MKAATADKAKRLDLYARMDGTFKKTLIVKNQADDSDFDFTDYTIELKIVDSWFRTPKLIVTTSNGLTVSAGRIEIEVDASVINFRKEDNYYFLWLTYPDGTKYVWLNGKFVVNHQLFDGLEDSEDIIISNDTEDVIIEVVSGIADPDGTTFADGIEKGEDNVARIGGTMQNNRTVNGNGVNMVWGTPESRFNQFLFRVAALFEILMPSGGAWRAVVGTAQAIVSGNSIAFIHDLIIEFTRPGSESSVLEVVTEEGNEQVRANAPIVLKQVNTQEELDALDPNQYAGSLVYKSFPTGLNQPQPIFSNGLWKGIRQIISIGSDILNSVVFGTNVYVHRIVLGESISELGYYYESTLVLELMSDTSFTLVAIADFTGSGSDQQILTMTKNSQGTYIVTTKVSLMIEVDTPTWLISINVSGPADINRTGHLIVAKDPSEFFDILFTATIASNNQLYHRFNTLKISTAE